MRRPDSSSNVVCARCHFRRSNTCACVMVFVKCQTSRCWLAVLRSSPSAGAIGCATVQPDDAAPREGSPLAALVARSLLGDANVTLVVTCQPEQAQVDAAARALRFAASVKQPTLLATPPTLKHDAAPALTPEMPSELVCSQPQGACNRRAKPV